MTYPKEEETNEFSEFQKTGIVWGVESLKCRVFQFELRCYGLY